MRSPPSRWWHLLSAAVFLGGAVGAPVIMVSAMMAQFSAGEEFFIPATHVFHAEQPGKYVVWNVISEFRDGMQHEYSENLPGGTRIRVLDGQTGKDVPTEAAMNSTESAGNSKHSSICTFMAPTAGSYSVIVDGLSEQRLILVRHSLTWRFARMFGLCGIACVLGWILAPVISIVVEVKRSRVRKELAGPPPVNSK